MTSFSNFSDDISKKDLRVISKQNFVVNIGDSEFGNLVVWWREQDINRGMPVYNNQINLWLPVLNDEIQTAFGGKQYTDSNSINTFSNIILTSYSN